MIRSRMSAIVAVTTFAGALTGALPTTSAGAPILPSALASSTQPTAGGNVLWEARYNGPSNSGDEANAVAVSPDGATVFVTGSGGSFGSYATVAYDAISGDLLWERLYGDYFSVAYALAVSPDGSTVYVTGESGEPNYGDYVTIAYDSATGVGRWGARYNGPDDLRDIAYAVAVSPDGSTIYVTGLSTGASSNYDYLTVAYNTANGARLWAKRYNGPGNLYDTANALGVSPDGSTVFVTGESWGNGSRWDYATIAYDGATGMLLWGARYNGAANEDDSAKSLGVSPDGSTVIVTGSSLKSLSSSADFLTIAYEASTGARLWGTRYNGSGDGIDVARSLGLSPDGSAVFVAGYSYGPTSSYDYLTLAYDVGSGLGLWLARYNGTRNYVDYAYALVVDPGGTKVFVTGDTWGFGYDYGTVAYAAATGAQLWASTYTGPGNAEDNANAVAVSAAGVFVTGRSTGASSSFDFATLAYEP